MLGDTILAPATADGAAERAIVRLSGPAARDVAGLAFAPALPDERTQVAGSLRIRGATVAALALVMPGPRSFTGEDVVELHLPGSPLLVASLREDLLARGAGLGARLAQPGEFTARACMNGRLDLAQAEGLLMLLHAADRRELATSAQWLRGGMSAALSELHDRLGDALALLESGLDFEVGETGTVEIDEVEALLAPAAERVAALLDGLPAAAPGGEILLLGAANAGKSSLCNALVRRAGVAAGLAAGLEDGAEAGAETAVEDGAEPAPGGAGDAQLVDAVAGTTRDLVRVAIGDRVALWDAPGDLDEPLAFDAMALQLRDRLAGRAAAAIAVVDLTAPRWPLPEGAGEPGAATVLPWLAVVFTKADLLPGDPAAQPAAALETAPAWVAAADCPCLLTSAASGAGLDALLALLRRTAHASAAAAGAPLRAALQSAAIALQRTRSALAAGPELAAVELQAAIRALNVDAAGHSAEPVLDRIYGRFCLGK